MFPAFIQRCAPAVLRASAPVPHNWTSCLVAHVRSLSSQSDSASTSLSESPVHPSWQQPPAATAGRTANKGPSSLEWGFIVREVKKAIHVSDGDVEKAWQNRETSIVRNLEKPGNAYSGRSVAIHKNEVGAAFVQLRRILASNNVVKELRLAERHEKKGDKRRRLRSERWRRRFAHEVRKKVQLVNQIRARGS